MVHRVRLLGLLVVACLIAAACGGTDRSDTEASEPTEAPAETPAEEPGGDGATAEAPAADGETTADDGSGSGDDEAPPEAAPVEPEIDIFGEDLPWPCGPGDASGATEQGVSDTTITIGVGDDRGFAGSPGLNKEMTDATLAFIDACNERGGINGRTIEANVYDGKIFSLQEAMAEACEQVFMLVGEGFALDDQGEELRVGCDLAAVPAFSASAVFAHGPMMYQAVPNPADQQSMSQAFQVAELFPDAIGNSAAMFGNFAATIEPKDKIVTAYTEAGYDFRLEIEYSVSGEEDWTPFVRQLQDGAGDGPIQHVFFSGSCLPNYLELRQATVRNGYEAIWTSDANFYTETCSSANTDGSMDETYIRMVYIPLEEADLNPAVGDFVEIVTGAGAEPSLLGMQGASSFLLWATAAQACGSDLTRDCVLAEIEAIDEWDSGGMHVPTTPRDNASPTCGVLVKLQGTEYVRVAPEVPGTFECDPSWIQPISTPASEAALLDENRVSTVFTGG